MLEDPSDDYRESWFERLQDRLHWVGEYGGCLTLPLIVFIVWLIPSKPVPPPSPEDVFRQKVLGYWERISDGAELGIHDDGSVTWTIGDQEVRGGWVQGTDSITVSIKGLEPLTLRPIADRSQWAHTFLVPPSSRIQDSFVEQPYEEEPYEPY
jgi:hypothetical protein